MRYVYETLVVEIIQICIRTVLDAITDPVQCNRPFSDRTDHGDGRARVGGFVHWSLHWQGHFPLYLLYASESPLLPQIRFSLLLSFLPYALARSPHIVSNSPLAVDMPIGQCFFPPSFSRIDDLTSVALP